MIPLFVFIFPCFCFLLYIYIYIYFGGSWWYKGRAGKSRQGSPTCSLARTSRIVRRGTRFLSLKAHTSYAHCGMIRLRGLRRRRRGEIDSATVVGSRHYCTPGSHTIAHLSHTHTSSSITLIIETLYILYYSRHTKGIETKMTITYRDVDVRRCPDDRMIFLVHDHGSR